MRTLSGVVGDELAVLNERGSSSDLSPGGGGDHAMTKEQKIIRAKVGLLELAKPLGTVSRACKMMGYSRAL